MANVELGNDTYNTHNKNSISLDTLLIANNTHEGIFDASIRDLFSCWKEYSELDNITVADVINESESTLLSRITVFSEHSTIETTGKTHSLETEYIMQMIALCRTMRSYSQLKVTPFLSFGIKYDNKNDGIIRVTHHNYDGEINIATTLLVTPEKAKEIKREYLKEKKGKLEEKIDTSSDNLERGINFIEWVQEREKNEEKPNPVLLKTAHTIQWHFDTFVCNRNNAYGGMYAREADIFTLSSNFRRNQQTRYAEIAHIAEQIQTVFGKVIGIIATSDDQILKERVFKLVKGGAQKFNGERVPIVPEGTLNKLKYTQQTMDILDDDNQGPTLAKTTKDG